MLQPWLIVETEKESENQEEKQIPLYAPSPQPPSFPDKKEDDEKEGGTVIIIPL